MANKKMIEHLEALKNELKSMNIEDLARLVSEVPVTDQTASYYDKVEKLVSDSEVNLTEALEKITDRNTGDQWQADIATEAIAKIKGEP